MQKPRSFPSAPPQPKAKAPKPANQELVEAEVTPSDDDGEEPEQELDIAEDEPA
jgi:hypothetical protein